MSRPKLRIRLGAAAGSSPTSTDGRSGRLPPLPRPHRLARLSGRRRTAGWLLAAGVVPLLILLLTALRSAVGPTAGLPELLLVVVAAAVVGGLLPAVFGAVLGVLLADWFLVPPVHSLTFGRAGDAAALASFVVVAVLVSGLLDRLTRRTAETARARAESEALARLAGGTVLAPTDALPALVHQLRSTFGVAAVAVLVPDGGGPGWRVEAAAGSPVPTRPDDAAVAEELAEGSVLVVAGDGLSEDDRRLLAAFVGELRRVQEQQRLQATAATVSGLEQANELRAALLAAVSHDLRTPLASIKASATSLLSSEIDWDGDTRRAFYETIDIETDRLTGLVANLLDMSRLQTGALRLQRRAVGLDEVVHAAIASLSGGSGALRVDVAQTLTPVLVDPALLERSVANLLANALTWSPPGHTVTVRGREVRGDADPGGQRTPPVRPGDPPRRAGRPDAAAVELHIVDTGPGIPAADRARAVQPFERLGDRAGGDGLGGAGKGVGLGLTVARGFVDLMGGRLVLHDTAGGGLTAVITLPTAAAHRDTAGVEIAAGAS